MTDEEGLARRRASRREYMRRRAAAETPEERDARLAAMRQRYRANQERRTAQQAEYRRQNRERLNALMRERYWRTREIRLAKAKEYRAANPERARDSVRRATKAAKLRLKQAILDHYGSVCQCCGEPNPAFLTLDHINGNGKAHRREIGTKVNGTPAFYRWLEKEGWPSGFQTLCWNCNCAKHHYGVCPHQAR